MKIYIKVHTANATKMTPQNVFMSEFVL